MPSVSQSAFDTGLFTRSSHEPKERMSTKLPLSNPPQLIFVCKVYITAAKTFPLKFILIAHTIPLTINEGDDPSEAYSNFISEFTRISEVWFPLKIIKDKQMNKCYSPCLSRGPLKSINKKNSLYTKLVGSPTTSCELRYRAYKNKLNHLHPLSVLRA